MEGKFLLIFEKKGKNSLTELAISTGSWKETKTMFEAVEGIKPESYRSNFISDIYIYFTIERNFLDGVCC